MPEALDGRSLLPLLRGEEGSPRRYAISDRQGGAGVSVRSSEYKLVQQKGERRFYRLREDPGETVDRYDPGDPAVQELAAVLDAYLARKPRAAEEGASRAPAPELRDQLRALGYLE